MQAPSTGVVVWLTGLPSSGKSTLAREVAGRLRLSKRSTCVLDGDEVRGALAPAPGFDPDGRDEFYATLARLAALLARQDLVVVVAATAHRRIYRADARRVAPAFVEVYVDVDADTCRQRDPKGLYARGTRDLPGADVPYEPPEAPDVVAGGGRDDAAIALVLEIISTVRR